MKAADLGDDAKQHLLGLVRDRIGESKYAELRRTQTEDQIVDMMLLAAEHQHATASAARTEVVEYHRGGFFWIFWLVLALLVGAFTGWKMGVMWFCSPWWFFFLFGAPVIPHQRWWGAVLVGILLAAGFFWTVSSTGRPLNDGEGLWLLFGGGIAAWILSWLAGVIAARRA